MSESPCVRPALLQEAVPDGKAARCLTCERRCLVEDSGLGWCRTRRNIGGVLHTLIYGAVSSLSANPIEKKPLYHFYPGTVALTVGSWSCNFGCPWCQNWDISKAEPRQRQFISPEQFVATCERWRCRGTSISFNEPTLSLEWSLDVFRLARRRELYNTLVTNGYMTLQALDRLVAAGLDAMNVDIKGSAEAVARFCKGVDVEVVWRNCQAAVAAGVHLEITTLVIPGVNDDPATLKSIAGRIAAELGPDVPWHVTRYYPAYRFDAPPTPLAALQLASDVGRDAGLRFVYIGNVPDHAAQHTYCPGCGRVLVRRSGLRIVANHVLQGRCPSCGQSIPGVGWLVQTSGETAKAATG